ncbi:MAG TPA: metalloregulator ArsR/SmtB family transcription factor [Acidimicrobiia bacterium]|nr:metalloregulator ArsR/SmtB family transcription factor [Acidimicrobiia bacterium]
MDALKIVAEPRRRELLHLIWSRELPAGEIADHFDLTFGAVSQHLGILREAGFVTVRKDGNRRYYQADQEKLGPLRPLLESMWSSTLDHLAQTIERDRG